MDSDCDFDYVCPLQNISRLGRDESVKAWTLPKTATVAYNASDAYDPIWFGIWYLYWYSFTQVYIQATTKVLRTISVTEQNLVAF